MMSGENGTLDRGDAFPLTVELACCSWILGGVAEGRPLPVIESDALVRALHAGLRVGSLDTLRFCVPQTESGYPATHALNTSLLSMILAEERGMDAREVRRIGLAGLLHDVGMSRLPGQFVQRPSELDPDELQVIEKHPGMGAAVLLSAGVELTLPAIVAYEHHHHVDGGGYPALRLSEEPHPASRLVQLASVYDALRSERPFRGAMSHGECLDDLRSGMGSQFDEALTRTLLRVMETWTPRYVPPPVRPSGSDGRSDEGSARPN